MKKSNKPIEEEKPKAISIPVEILSQFREKELIVRIAQQELEMVDLKARLILNVPNDFLRNKNIYIKSEESN